MVQQLTDRKNLDKQAELVLDYFEISSRDWILDALASEKK